MYSFWWLPLAIFILGFACDAPQKQKTLSNASTVGEIALPTGFIRKNMPKQSFGGYLRSLPLSKDNTVYLFNGELKARQDVQFAVLTIDVGKRDLQQCADAVMRLRAEYLFSQKRFADIHFNFTSGHKASYLPWRDGERPQIHGNTVNWKKTARPDSSYQSFRKYLDIVFSYAGTLSLAKELTSVPEVEAIEIGDVFIQGGSPGHAVLVMDIAENPTTQEKIFLLAQSYMPAQSIHILLNFNNTQLSPWYSLKNTDTILSTPEWEFEVGNLKRW